MTCDERLYGILTGLGIPGAKQAYPDGDAPSPPFFIYTLDSNGEFFADDSNWVTMPRYRVQLLERHADAALEGRVLSALEGAYGPVTVYEDWSQSEHARIVSYYFTDKHNRRK